MTVQGLLPGNTAIDWSENEIGGLIQVRSPDALPENTIKQIADLEGIGELISVTPILPVLSGREGDYPFTDMDGLLVYARENKYSRRI